MKNSILFLLLVYSSHIFAADYPDMVGAWSGQVRVISSGENVSDQVAFGGAVLSEQIITVTINYQEGETFIGNSRSSGFADETRSNTALPTLRSPSSQPIAVY